MVSTEERRPEVGKSNIRTVSKYLNDCYIEGQKLWFYTLYSYFPCTQFHDLHIIKVEIPEIQDQLTYWWPKQQRQLLHKYLKWSEWQLNKRVRLEEKKTLKTKVKPFKSFRLSEAYYPKIQNFCLMSDDILDHTTSYSLVPSVNTEGAKKNVNTF